ncbi:CHAT domain-containing protein [Iningainema tapete]|uniref:CHAT domain-containing protein n=1 Tax=Iningainema tapete BLCC-T55 TaxID=2748662 RepID=A0A8J6XF47_9CYAN|nr:CHAT domain-containing protein [Iningainema tapete]MBD2772673.1 CHAT domain-containing protein [Iningainema tapete BLCC-T55]
MSKLIFLAVAPIAIATTPIALAVAAKNYPQPTQVVQSDNGKQLLQQGLKLYQTEQFSQAAQVLQQAAVKFQTEGDALNQALALNYTALATQQLGQLPQASQAIANSLTLLPENASVSKEYLSVRAQALNTQGQIQLAQGQYEQALASWQEATTLYKKIGDSAGEIGSKINQTQAQQALGLYNRARITLNEVNQLLQQQPDPQLKARGLLSLGNALRVVGILDQKDPQGSLQVLEQSLAVASKLNSPQLVAEINLSLGNTAQALYLRLGKTDEGRKNITKAIEYYQQAAADNALPLTRLVAQINQLRLVIESPDARKKVSYQALLPQIQSQLETLPPSHKIVYARINYAQSLVCLKQKTEKTRVATSLACPIQEKEELDTTTYPTPEWAQIETIVATAAEQAKSLGDKRGQAYALGTLGGLYEQTQQWEQAQKLTQQASALAESIQAKDIGYRWQWQLGRILKTRGNQTAAIAAYTKAVDNLKSLRSDLVAVNRDVQSSFRVGVEPVYRELVSLLLESKDPSQDNLVSARNVIESLQLAELDNFFRRACIDAKPVQIDEVDRTAAVIYPVILSDRLEVILSVPSNSPNQKQILRRHTIALNQKQVEGKIEQLRLTLENRTTPEYLPLSQEVYKWIIEPIASDLANRRIKNLVFVLDGSLRNIPMGALHDGKQFLVNQYNIALTPGLQLLNPRPLARTQLRTVAGGLTEAKGNFSSLPYVKVELEQIKSTVSDTQVLLNNNFTTSAIENAVKSVNAPVVHLATHGQFSSKAEDTFILTNDGKIDVERLNSLLKTRETNQQGAIELLVLSACSTASGDREAALGIAGVAVRSGARSTLASLWVVDDEATSVIMGEFYQQLKKPNMTKAEAFKLAQLSMLKDERYEHPYFWAPYVLVGNWL